MNDNELSELFSEMRDDPVPAESLARVRMAVAGRVQARRRVLGMGWKIAVPLAVAGCIAAVMLRPRPVAPAAAPAPSAIIAVEQSAPVEAPPPKPAVHMPVRAVAKPVRHAQEAPASNVDAGGAHEIRIENPYDPDVVIVLIGG